MKAQCQRQHAGPEAHMVVNPVGRTSVMVLPRNVGANPHSYVRCHVEVSGIRVWRVLIDWRGPVDRYAAQNQAKKKWHVQPMAPTHQRVMPFNNEHARLYQ